MGGERGREERTRHTVRGWPVNSRAEEKTIVFLFPWLGPSVISVLGKEAIELNTSHEYSFKEKWLVPQYHFVYSAARAVKIYHTCLHVRRDANRCLQRKDHEKVCIKAEKQRCAGTQCGDNKDELTAVSRVLAVSNQDRAADLQTRVCGHIR